MSGATIEAVLDFPDGLSPTGWPSALLLVTLLATCAVIVSVDIRERIIPDACNLLVAVLGLAFAAPGGTPAIAAALVHGVATFALFWLFRAAYRRLRGHHGLGLGDVKFLGAAATWTGFGGVPPLVVVACGAALAMLAVGHARGRTVSARHAIPFGPFLVIGLVGVLAVRLL